MVDVMQQMNQAQASCALVIEHQQLIGIFTETDVLRAMSNIKHLCSYNQLTTFEEISITEFMTQPVITLSQTDAENIATVLKRFHQHRIRHLPVIDSSGQVLKVITPWEVMDKIYQLNSGKTAAPEQEITQPQQMSQLMTAREIKLNEIFDGEVLTTKFRMKHKDGAWRWLRSPEVVFAREKNNIASKVLGITEDISAQQAALAERKLAEEALRKSEALLAEAQRVARLGNWEYDLATGKISWSKELFRLFNRDLALGDPNYEELFEIFCLEDRQKLRQAVEQAISTGESYKLLLRVLQPDGCIMYMEAIGHAEFNQEGEVIRLYGTGQDITERKLATITYEECLSFIGQEEWWITSLTPLRDENSQIYRIVGNSVNITERKRAEQMLELQAVITRNMAEGICLIRATDGVFVYTNPKFEQIFGYDCGELIGQHVSIINYADDQTKAKAVYESLATTVLENGEATYELHNVKKDGTQFWNSGTASVFEHPEYGTVFVAVQQDITEQKQAEEKIKASLKEKEILLQEIHHRVKNNLGIVSSLLQMQWRRTQDPQAKAILRDSQNRIASIALVHEKLYRSSALADIDFSQYITDLTTHLFESYNVSSSQIQLQIQVAHASLDIETAIPCGLILNELVSNALKYAFPHHHKGEIKIRCYSENNMILTLIIEDNGIGLPADWDSKKSKTLGLTLVQGLVEQLRGTIEINCQQGTKFKITFTKGRESSSWVCH